MHDIIFLNFYIISSAGLLLASIKKFTVGNTAIIRWPTRRVAALQVLVVRTLFLGPKPRLFPINNNNNNNNNNK